jgi:cytochrome c oxidase subunit II
MPSPVRRKPLAVTSLVLALAFALVETALAGNGGVAPPEPASPSADSIRDVYWLLLGVAAVIFVFVEVALVLFIVKYRGGDRPREEEGPQVIGHHRLELLWTAVPVLILVVIGAFVFYKLPGINDTPEANAAGDKITIRVEGRQFYWRYVYPGGRVSVNELRAPVGRVVELELTAPAHDVIHSWWVPSLAGKKDAVPGKINRLWFEAREPGLYRGQCGEYCGAQHALMVAQVRAVPQAEYDSWLRGPDAGVGEQIFQGACAPCHGDRGQGLIGPELRGPDPELLRATVRNGRGAMPAVGRGWNETEMRALVEYVTEEIGDEGGG